MARDIKFNKVRYGVLHGVSLYEFAESRRVAPKNLAPCHFFPHARSFFDADVARDRAVQVFREALRGWWGILHVCISPPDAHTFLSRRVSWIWCGACLARRSRSACPR